MEQSISTVVICDDHPIFRGGLAQIINDQDHLELIGECSDGDQAIDLITSKSPDIAILDVSMPGKDGIEVAQNLSEINLPVKIIILTMHKDKTFFDKALDADVKGYLLKENASADLLKCIEKVQNDEYYVSSLLSDLLIDREKKIKTSLNKNPDIDTLTETELKILKLLADNKTSKEIAERLFISYRTVQNHRQHISDKLNLHGPHKLLQFALENKHLL